MSLTAFAEADDVTRSIPLEILGAEDSYPFSYEENGQIKGVNIEIVQAIQSQLKYKYKISLVPWPRAYHSLLARPNVIFISVSRTKEREKLFSMVGPIGTKDFVFFKKKNSPLKIDSIEDALKVQRIAARRNTIYESYLQKMGFKDFISTQNTLQNHHLLEGNRVDLFLDSDIQTVEVLKKENINVDSIQKAYVVMKLENYVSFSKGTPRPLIREWKMALQKIKANGTFEEIYRKWLPHAKIPMHVEETHPSPPP